jgi:hypothetical protein
LSAPAQRFNPQSPGPGKKVQYILPGGVFLQDVKDSFLYPVGGGSEAQAFQSKKLLSLALAADDPQTIRFSLLLGSSENDFSMRNRKAQGE